ncbi:MAG: DDE domain-containing protein [Clostridia bacterium]|nr:DDE domain-containing protein [Clostridia bacterium]
MNSIITFLIQFNQSLLAKIDDLLKIIEELTPKRKDSTLESPKYRKLEVDKPPIVRDFAKLDYRELIKSHEELWGKTIKPVKSRGGTPVPKEVTCPYCGAPHKYLYDNSGGRGQILCKICSSRFSREKQSISPVSLFCPYCGRSLSKIKTRKGFSIHKCVNDDCSFYKGSLKKLSSEDKLEYEAHPERYKLRYLYREFHLKFSEMELYSMPKGSVNFNFRDFSPHILGLCLTYMVNLGLSSRVTQRALLEIHGVKISHVTVSKYAKTAAAILQPYVDSYDYKPTQYLAADETYVKVKGTRHYVWFVMDVIKKSILGYSVSDTRTLEPCLRAMRMAFDKFTTFPGMAMKFIADGFPIYKLAQIQFALEKMEFPLTQVIGLTNEDPVSTEYRWTKQVMERLNRTFKFSYRVTNGYGNIQGADSHVALFVAFYNFLRPHPYNYWRPLNQIPELEKLPNMPAKWQKLIELSQKHLRTIQNHTQAS